MLKLETKAGGSQKGFTLIEMSIVLVIIGLIIGGILKGQEIINSSRQKNLGVQIQSVNSALNTFNDKYNAVPGDYTQAVQNISATTANGGGDGIVGVAQANIGGILGDASTTTTAVGGAAVNTDGENALFWCQLSAAGLIGGSSTDCTTAITVFGNGSPLPAAAYAQTGLDVVFGANNVNGLDAPIGLWMRIHHTVGAVTDTVNSWALSPRDMGALDQKFDDGRPGTGLIRGAGAGQGGCNATAPANVYTLSQTQPGCVALVEISN